MTEKPRIYVTFEPEIYSQVAAYGEKRRITSKSEAAHDLIRIGLEACAASNAPAPKDPYSQRFREHVEFELQRVDPADMEAWAESGGKLNGAIYEDSPLTLAEACEIANEMGFSLSDLMGEEEEDYISFRQKIDPDVTRARGKLASEEMEKLLRQLTPEQAEFLLAVMRRMLKPIRDYVK